MRDEQVRWVRWDGRPPLTPPNLLNPNETSAPAAPTRPVLPNLPDLLFPHLLFPNLPNLLFPHLPNPLFPHLPNLPDLFFPNLLFPHLLFPHLPNPLFPHPFLQSPTLFQAEVHVHTLHGGA